MIPTNLKIKKENISIAGDIKTSNQTSLIESFTNVYFTKTNNNNNSLVADVLSIVNRLIPRELFFEYISKKPTNKFIKEWLKLLKENNNDIKKDIKDLKTNKEKLKGIKKELKTIIEKDNKKQNQIHIKEFNQKIINSLKSLKKENIIIENEIYKCLKNKLNLDNIKNIKNTQNTKDLNDLRKLIIQIIDNNKNKELDSFITLVLSFLDMINEKIENKKTEEKLIKKLEKENNNIIDKIRIETYCNFYNIKNDSNSDIKTHETLLKEYLKL